MKTNHPSFSTRTLVLAVRCALLTMAVLPGARAADPAPATPAVANPAASNPAAIELTQRQNSIEAGVGYVNKSSNKFGQYNGLFDKGAYAIGNLDISGGGTYDSEDPTRWFLRGTDLGLEIRDIGAQYGRQGSYWVGIVYDELRSNRSDTYQTPYNGAGSNFLTLPPNWVVPVVPAINPTTANARGLSPAVATSPVLVNGVLTPPTPAQLATSANLINADVPSFHNVNLDTIRKTTSVGVGTLFGQHWEAIAGYRHEDKTGLKPMGMISRQTGSDIASIMPDLIDQTTDQWDASLNFTGERSFLHVGYYGSFFTNHVDSMTWQNWAKLTVPNFNTMSTAPTNQFNQVNFTGGYNFSPTTQLVVDGAYGRSTQNVALLTDATTPVVPVSSADAEVISKNLSLKLTGRPDPRLQLLAFYKFDERDNRTPVNTYQFSDNNQPLTALFPGGGVVAQNANANTPYSKRLNQVDLSADYRIATGQAIKGGYQFQKLDRWCEGTWISCVEAETTKQNALLLEYRNNVVENLSGRITYEYSMRDVGNYNENAFLSLVPYANVSPNGAPGGSTAYGTMLANGLNGWGPNSGINPVAPPGSALGFFFPNNNAMSNALYANENRISELPGMRLYNMADRNQNKLRTALDWQPSEKLSLQGGFNYQDDDYPDSVYGLTKARGWALNFDANFQVNENFGVSGFYTHEDFKVDSAGNTYTPNSTATSVNGFTAVSGGCYSTIAARNFNFKIDPCLNWTSDLHDEIDTFGLNFQYKGLLAGKLQLFGDLVWSSARSNGTFTGGNYVNNPLAVTGAPPGTVAAYYIPATPLPAVTTKTIAVSLAAEYSFDPQKAVRFSYLYSRMRSVDWAYDGMQYGGLVQLLPDLEQAPNYSVSVFGVSFIYSFR